MLRAEDATQALVDRLTEQCDDQALAELFSRYRSQLQRIVEFRMDPRLAKRVDSSDVLQQAYLDAQTRVAHFANRGSMPFSAVDRENALTAFQESEQARQSAVERAAIAEQRIEELQRKLQKLERARLHNGRLVERYGSIEPTSAGTAMTDPNSDSAKFSKTSGALTPGESEKQPGWTWPVVTSLIVVAVAAGILDVMGRTWWCECGGPSLWAGNIWSRHNSQHLFDPYTFSHVLHGLLFYALLVVMAPGWTPKTRAVLAMVIESAWEVLENTPWVIEKYRESTISLDYYGDSILNSVADIATCALGYGLAACLPVWLSVAGFAAVEALTMLWIRDGLLLNVLMLLYPIDAIKTWQMGG